VLVPSDRVFYLHRREGHRDLLGRMLAWAFYHILIRMAVKAEVLAGIATAISDYLGKQEALATQLSLVDLYSYAETLRAFVRAAEDDPVPSVSGFVVPNPTQITLGRIHAVDRLPQMLQLVRELSGSGLLMAPGHDDFGNPAIRADVERYLIGPDSMAADRFQLLKLAREYTSESFGARQLLFEMHNAGAQLTTKQRLAASYDASAHVRLAKQLAGIEPTGLGHGSRP
jgi:aromatic ring hydroxylase